MHEVHSYEGHSIDLDLKELPPGRMQCTYFIDAAYCFQYPAETNTLDSARKGAIERARASIDALNRLKQRSPGATACELRSAVGAAATTDGDGVEQRLQDLGRAYRSRA